MSEEDSVDSLEFENCLEFFFSEEENSTSNDSTDDTVSICSSAENTGDELNDQVISCDINGRPKPKRIRPYKYTPRIRILKRDVRRSYAEMYVNVWNYVDLPMLFGFLDTYFAPNFRQESIIDPQGTCVKQNPTIPISSSIQGLLSVTKFWYTMMLLFPNTSITLKDTQVISCEDKTQNRVVARVHIKGTRICAVPSTFDIKASPVSAEESSLYSEKIKTTSKRSHQDTENNTPITTSGRAPIVESLLRSTQATVDAFPLSSEGAFTMDIEGSIIMYTDEQNRVSKFVMVNHSGMMGKRSIVGGLFREEVNNGV